MKCRACGVDHDPMLTCSRAKRIAEYNRLKSDLDELGKLANEPSLAKDLGKVIANSKRQPKVGVPLVVEAPDITKKRKDFPSERITAMPIRPPQPKRPPKYAAAEPGESRHCKYKDVEKRRVYMRDLMRKKRSEKKVAAIKLIEDQQEKQAA